jgi:hypothetical protein
MAGAVYRFESSFQVFVGVAWRGYVNIVDCELERVEGVSPTGEKYELPPRSDGETVPAENWV